MSKSRGMTATILAGVSVLCAAGIMTVALGQQGAGAAAGEGPARPAAFKPAQSVEQMMHGQDMLMKQVKSGIMDKAWDNAATSAWVLAEIANVNQYQHESGEYRAIAGRMSGQCMELANMLKKHDEKAAMEQVRVIGQSCKSCHDVFRKE